ncbi:GNAT family N-acetyltransferase [Tenacibaculum sp. 190524A02b]|uniref:GNAT family N-acetyltransferase n=1 Tax=Tenacibaculum vairaonense TaxID=3137860 RepID=UPI0031FAC8F9
MVREAYIEELNWINKMYNEANFVSSDFNCEFIVIAEIANEKAGLGRLVKIDENNVELGGIYVLPDYRGKGVAGKVVDYLCKNNPYQNATIWCLPFENLLSFYEKFGFSKEIEVVIPYKIENKYNWCNIEANYTEKVLLLNKGG